MNRSLRGYDFILFTFFFGGHCSDKAVSMNVTPVGWNFQVEEQVPRLKMGMIWAEPAVPGAESVPSVFTRPGVRARKAGTDLFTAVCWKTLKRRSRSRERGIFKGTVDCVKVWLRESSGNLQGFESMDSVGGGRLAGSCGRPISLQAEFHTCLFFWARVRCAGVGVPCQTPLPLGC